MVKTVRLGQSTLGWQMTGSGFLTSEPSTTPGTGNRLEESEGPRTEEAAADKATEYFAQLTPQPASSLSSARSYFQTETVIESLFQPLEGGLGIKSNPGTQGPGLGFAVGHGR